MSRSLSHRTSKSHRQKSINRGERDRMFSEAKEVIRVPEEEGAQHLEQPHSTHN